MTAGDVGRRSLPRVLRVSQDTLDRMSDDEKFAWFRDAVEAEQSIQRQGVL